MTNFVSIQLQGIVEAAKEIIPLAEHRQCARHIYANFRKKFTGVLFRNLFWKASKATYPAKFEKYMEELNRTSKDAVKHLRDRQPKSWSRAFFTTDRACDAVENGISECFNSLIVDARRKPIINMLEDIRLYIILRMEKMRVKHQSWTDEICPSIRKKIALIQDLHRNWEVFPSGNNLYEVRNGYHAFRVDEVKMTCSCRLWQLSGIPCEHGYAVIFHLHKNPDNYVSNYFKKTMFFNAYNHFINPLNGIEQWPPSEHQKPLPPIARRMPGRPKHKRRRDAFEGGNQDKTKVSRVGRVMHCTNCREEGHNKTTCTKEKVVKPPKKGGGRGSRCGGRGSTGGGDEGPENDIEEESTTNQEQVNEEEIVEHEEVNVEETVDGQPMLGVSTIYFSLFISYCHELVHMLQM